jgi:hypothetical protein
MNREGVSMSPRKEQIGPADWWLRNGAWFIAITFLLLSGTFAFADDKSECLDGIKAIKAAVAKKPPKPVLDKLKRALDSAEQEEFEGDWDERVAAVRQAKLPKEKH